jgi:hypothetical protein
MRFFASGFFHESSSPKPLQITLGNFRVISNFFRKIAEIFASQGSPLVSTTPVVNLPPVIIDTGGKFLPPVPLVLLILVENF